MLYGLTPVVISATLGNNGGGHGDGIAIGAPASILEYVYSFDKFVESAGRAIVSRLAASDRVEGPSRKRGEGPALAMVDPECECVWLWLRCEDVRVLMEGTSVVTLESENGTTPARRAMSASPSCQCMASAARHGTCISSAIFAHISGLSLACVSSGHASRLSCSYCSER